MAVITMSRQMGSGGSALGRQLARRLGYAFVDKDLILRVARKLHVSEESVEPFDQEEFSRGMALLEHFLTVNPTPYTVLAVGLPAMTSDIGLGAAIVTALNEKRYLQATQQLIKALARKGKVIIMGRGGQVLLAGQKDAIHLRIVAPLDDRVRHVRGWLKLADAGARQLIAHRDKACAQYLKHHYHRDWDDPLLYDLTINTGQIDTSAAVETVVTLLKKR